MPDKSKIIRIAQIAAISITALLLLGAFGFLFAEGGWLHTETRPPQQAFLFGNTGTEIMPLPVFEALPDLFPDQFQPGGPEAGDWMDQFGFIHGTPEVNQGLPV